MNLITNIIAVLETEIGIDHLKTGNHGKTTVVEAIKWAIIALARGNEGQERCVHMYLLGCLVGLGYLLLQYVSHRGGSEVREQRTRSLVRIVHRDLQAMHAV